MPAIAVTWYYCRTTAVCVKPQGVETVKWWVSGFEKNLWHGVVKLFIIMLLLFKNQLQNGVCITQIKFLTSITSEPPVCSRIRVV